MLGREGRLSNNLDPKFQGAWSACIHGTFGEGRKAEAKRARTSFSASPCHLEVRVEAEMLKKVASASDASAFASSVLPLPGGPYSSRPRAGARRPWNRSARCAGRITISCSACTGSYYCH